MKVDTVKDALGFSSGTLRSAGVSRPLGEAERILCRLLDCDRVELYLEASRPIGEEEILDLERMLGHRVNGLPLQYVTGKTGFYTCEFMADSRALIPRPDTETVIDAVLDLVDRGMNFGRILDAGTGSGNIAVVLAGHLPGCEVWATDISEEAILLARKNAALNSVEKIHFIVADFLAPFGPGSFDLVVANPPYVSDVEWPFLPREVRDHEPPVALRGGPDGLDMIRNVIRSAFDVLSDDGVVILEVGHTQYGRVYNLFVAAGYREIELRRDINGKPRVAVAYKSTPGSMFNDVQ